MSSPGAAIRRTESNSVKLENERSASFCYFLSEHGFLGPRGALHIADAEGLAALAEVEAEFGDRVAFERLDRAGLEARLPGLREGWVAGLIEPSCADIDVAGLHAFYLARARRAGARGW